MAAPNAGTAGYRAPEAGTGQGAPRPQVDVYAVAVMIYQLLEGRLPFDGAATALLEPVQPAALNAAQWDVLKRGFANRAGERPESVAALLDALRQAAEPSAEVPNDPDRYICNTVPGARLPSLFLKDGRAVYAQLDRWFSLLAFGDVDSTAAERAAAARGIPLKIIRIADDHARRIYAADMLLVRPDQHIAWRGNSLDEASAARVLAMALGW